MSYGIRIEFSGGIFQPDAGALVSGEIEAAMTEAVMLLEAEVKQRTPQGVGGAESGLRASIEGNVRKAGGTYEGEVTHGTTYGDVIEYGRRPGSKMPPKGVLRAWMSRKSGTVDPRIEFLIRRKIGRDGFPGAYMFRDALKESAPNVERIFEGYGARIAEVLD